MKFNLRIVHEFRAVLTGAIRVSRSETAKLCGILSHISLPKAVGFQILTNLICDTICEQPRKFIVGIWHTL